MMPHASGSFHSFDGSVACPICEASAPPLERATVLGRFEVQYYRCTTCGFTFTENPYWLAHAYTTGMSDCDLGPINRCFECSEMTRALLLTCFDPRGRYVDYGAGYGIFVRRMRDLGFDFQYFDKYPSNIFAKGFEAVARDGYELLTAFEVFEHLTNPLGDVRSMLGFSSNIFFSTVLLPPNLPKPHDWVYYGLEHGQHVSFHTRQSLAKLAQRCGCHLISDGMQFHLLTRKKIPESFFKQIIRPGFRSVVGSVLTRVRAVRSLLPDDFSKASVPSVDTHSTKERGV